MTRRLILPFSALAPLALFSCYPYPEPPPGGPRPGETVTGVEQQKIEEQRERMRLAQEEQAKRELEAQGLTGPTNQGGGTTTPPPTKPAAEKKDYPFATPVPGKDGFVFSPYNNKVIDVRDMPTGTLVQDPTFPAAEKKYFRVP